MEVILENERAVLSLNPELQAVELRWKTTHDQATYRLMYRTGLEYLQTHNISRWLSDIHHQGVVGPEDIRWMQIEILPKAQEAGLKKIAVLMDRNVFKTYYMRSIQNFLDNQQGSVLQYFGDRAKAETWLTAPH